MHIDPEQVLREAERVLHNGKQSDPIASHTDSIKEMEIEESQSDEAKTKQALNNDTGRTRLKNTNTDNQYRT